jgi:uncharacterized SAM-binding protein YcdF (DUF218 family)
MQARHAARKQGSWGLVRRAKGCLVSMAVAAVVAVVAFQLRAPILGWVGGLLYHADELMPADAIVVLGGNSMERDLEGATLLAEGYGPAIVVTQLPESPVREALRARGLSVDSAVEVRLGYLVALGVPRTDVTVLQRVVHSTQDEATLVAEWAESRQIQRLIVVTSAFHTARTRYVFSRTFRDLDTDVLIHPARESTFNPATWWQTRSHLRDGLFELQKHAYYRLAYLMGGAP